MGAKTKWDDIETAVGEIEIKFRRHGYNDPGQPNGDPDDCRAPEGDDQREITQILIDGDRIDFQLLAARIIEFVENRRAGMGDTDDRIESLIRYIEEALFQPIADSWEP